MMLPPELTAVVTDLLQLGTLGGWALSLYFLRDIYISHKELTKRVVNHGERLIRLETQIEAIDERRAS